MALGLEQRFETQDGPRRISFIGWRLGEADSRPGGEQPARWTELRLYKTIGGPTSSSQYVLEKVGCSDVFHNETCPTEPGKPRRGKRWDNLWDALPDDVDEPEGIFVPCEKCTPSYDDAPVWVERDIYSTSTFSTPAEVLRALERPDTRGTANRYLSRVARALLDQAVEKDAELRVVVSAPIELE